MILLLYADRPGDRSFHDYLSITVSKYNDPPDPPGIYGKTSGKPGITYTYEFTAFEPDEQDVSYYVDWGDGTITDWTDYQASGTPYSEDHIWETEDTFEIKAKAKDIHGGESVWSTLKITIPRNRALFNKPTFMSLFDDFQNVLSFLQFILRLL